VITGRNRIKKAEPKLRGVLGKMNSGKRLHLQKTTSANLFFKKILFAVSRFSKLDSNTIARQRSKRINIIYFSYLIIIYSFFFDIG
jgi:hypothetical protein